MDQLLRSKYLVLSGGGINGLSQIGALRAMESILQKRIVNHFEGFAGSSVGALICLHLTCGLPIHTLIEDFEQGRGALTNMSLSLHNFTTHKGGLSGYSPIDTVISHMLPWPTIDFDSLYKRTKKHLIVVAVDITSASIHYFDHKRTPTVSVAKAVLASMAIPAIYPPVQIGQGLYTDGGLCMNFPFCVFPKRESFGLWLRSFNRGTHDSSRIMNSSVTFFKTIASTLYYGQDVLMHEMVFPEFRERIIIIPMFPLPGSPDDVNTDTMQRQGFMATWMHMRSLGGDSCLDSQLVHTGLATGILRIPTRRVVMEVTRSVLWVIILVNAMLWIHFKTRCYRT
jgi:predicted acylesterase/phospholipase RssA